MIEYQTEGIYALDARERVQRAICLVRRQVDCDPGVALGLMKERARVSETTVERVAAMIIDGRIAWTD